MNFIDSANRSSTRSFTGVRLRDFLEAQNIDPAAVRSVTVHASDGDTNTVSNTAWILSNNTLLAWEEERIAPTAVPRTALPEPRFCPGDSGHAGYYTQYVVSLGLTY